MKNRKSLIALILALVIALTGTGIFAAIHGATGNNVAQEEAFDEEAYREQYAIPSDAGLTAEARNVSRVMNMQSHPIEARALTEHARFTGAIAWPYKDCPIDNTIDPEHWINLGDMTEQETDSVFKYDRETVYRNLAKTYQMAEFMRPLIPATSGGIPLGDPSLNPWYYENLAIYRGEATSEDGRTGPEAFYDYDPVSETYFVNERQIQFANKLMILWDRVFVRGDKIETNWDTTKFMVLRPIAVWDSAPTQWSTGVHDKLPVLPYYSITKDGNVDIKVGFNIQGQNLEVYEEQQPAPQKPSNPAPAKQTPVDDNRGDPTPSYTPTPPKPRPDPTPEPTDGNGRKDPDADPVHKGNDADLGGKNKPDNDADPKDRENQPNQGYQDPVATKPDTPGIKGDHGSKDQVTDHENQMNYAPDNTNQTTTWNDNSNPGHTETYTPGNTPSTPPGNSGSTTPGTGGGETYNGEYSPPD